MDSCKELSKVVMTLSYDPPQATLGKSWASAKQISVDRPNILNSTELCLPGMMWVYYFTWAWMSGVPSGDFSSCGSLWDLKLRSQDQQWSTFTSRPHCHYKHTHTHTHTHTLLTSQLPPHSCLCVLTKHRADCEWRSLCSRRQGPWRFLPLRCTPLYPPSGPIAWAERQGQQWRCYDNHNP